ncbi:MAG: tryptophan 7-halogenase [Henriciella sp.]|nr:tryptophan 7-halogenase [Henriciella sp.]
MGDRDPVTIVGPPEDAWLTATMLARFASLSGARLQVLETPSTVKDHETVIARPEMVRTHVSVGLNPKSLGARPVQSWTGPSEQLMPLTPIGQVYKGVSFLAIHHRAQKELGETRPFTKFASSNASGAFAIEIGLYVRALKAIATKVGVSSCAEAEGHVLISDPSFRGAEKSRVIGAAAMELKPSPTLRLQAVHQSVLALIECWTWRESDRGLSDKEYHRRLGGIVDSMTDMQTLLWEGDRASRASNRLQHRIEVWRNIGRIAPMDDDQFQAQEWMAALLQADIIPQNVGRLSRSLTHAEIAAHLDACATEELANVG